MVLKVVLHDIQVHTGKPLANICNQRMHVCLLKKQGNIKNQQSKATNPKISLLMMY